MKTALVLEGGAMRGLFTAGVIDAMMENGIEYDALIGVSAGIAFGCNYKSRQIGRVLRYNKMLCKNKYYCSLWSLVHTGDLYGGQFCYHDLPEQIDIMDKKTYDANPMKMIAVCTDANTGKAIYPSLDILDYRSLEYMRASASMPIASHAVRIDGMELLDGGIADSIPVRYMQNQGYEKIVVVLTQPKDYIKKPQVGMPVLKRLLKSYPMIAEDLKERHIAYNDTTAYIKEEVNRGTMFAIYPETDLPVGKIEHDAKKLELVYDIGHDTMLAQMDALKSFLKG